VRIVCGPVPQPWARASRAADGGGAQDATPRTGVRADHERGMGRMDPATVECTPQGKQGALSCQDRVLGGCLDLPGDPSDPPSASLCLRDAPRVSPAAQLWLGASFARVRACCRCEPGQI